MRRDSAERGFTLVEVLVALVVSAFLMVIVIDGSVGARSRLRAAEQKRASILVADSVIATAAVAPYRAVPQTGVTGDRAWQVAETIEATDRRGLFALVRIEARITARPPHPAYIVHVRRLKSLNPP